MVAEEGARPETDRKGDLESASEQLTYRALEVVTRRGLHRAERVRVHPVAITAIRVCAVHPACRRPPILQ